MFTKTSLFTLLAASAYGNPTAKYDAVDEDVSFTEPIDATCEELLQKEFFDPNYTRNYFNIYAHDVIFANTNEDTGAFEQNKNMEFFEMYEQFIEEHRACADTPEMEKVLNGMWQQTAAWSVAQVNYEILKLKKFDEFADQFAVSQEAFASNDMQTLIDVLGLDYDEICGVFAKEEDCDVSIAEEAFEAEEEEEDDEEEDDYKATEAIETIEGDDEEVEVEQTTVDNEEENDEDEFESGEDSDLSAAGILGGEEEGSADYESPSIFEGEDVAVGSNSIWFSVSLLLAGCYLI